MADEQDKWLDRETAELLLRGEPLEGVDPASRDRAGRLLLALDALSAPPPPTGEELPGEAAALAAFRKVRAERADASAKASAALGHGTAPRPADAGLVRIGEGARRPRRSRPLRLGLAAALTVGMLGGVAAAGTGVLPTPFDGAEPEPAATVSAAVSPGRPSAPPTPLEGVQGGAVPGTTPGTPDGGTARDGGRAGDRDTDDRDAGGSDGRRKGLTASCRKLRAGKELDTAHRRALKEAAGGASRVVKYCAGLLAGNDGGGREGGDHGGDAAEPTREGELRRDTGDDDGKSGKSDKGDKDNKGGKSDKGGKGNGGKKGGHGDQGDDGDDGGDGDDADAAIAPPARDPQHPDRPDRPHRSHGPHGPHARSAYTPPAPSPTSTA
ncbi:MULTISPECIES: hypothetical protein [unclassified Streptomyces]|uniref:hypothetical protein n=1 Tax=unclassified Streptomyces TaxID=2593676 RepID=UPI000F4C82AF